MVVVSDRGEQSCGAPKDRAEEDQRVAREAVGEIAENGSGDHIADKKRGGQKAEIGIGGVKFLFYKRLNGEEDGAVDIIEEIQGRQQREGQARVQFGSHGESLNILHA